MFLYGRGVRERSEFYRLKAGYFTLKFHPRYLITLVTCHDTSPFKKLVARTRIELVIVAYQATVIPFNYPAINMCMITADEAMIPLYREAQGVYQQRFYSTTTRKFTLNEMLINPPKEFKLDTTFMVHPDGLEPPTASV